MKIIEIDESYSGKRIDRFLISYFKNCSKNFIYKLFRLKKIKVNGKAVELKYILNKGDKIFLFVSDKQFDEMLYGQKIAAENDQKEKFEQYFLTVIYEDDYLLIVQKPSDTVVIEDEKEKKWVLTEFVRSYIEASNKLDQQEDKNIQANFKISPVHRIDRNTNGLVIFAKTYQAFNELVKVFKERKIEKEYLAIVKGQLLYPKKIVLNLVKDEKLKTVFVDEENDKNNTKTAITYIEPLAITKEATLIRATIETGRTHQIRVTLSNSGHPIINDIKYGKKILYEEFNKKFDIKQILLLAYSIKFEDNLPLILSNLSGKRFFSILPDFWVEILQKQFNISQNKLEELLEKIRK